MDAADTAIRELIQHWHRATQAGEVDAVAELMTEDAVFLTPGHEPMRGRAAFVAGLKKVLEAVRIDSTAKVLQIDAAGDLASAWVELSVTMIPRDGGASQTRRGHAMSVYRRDGDGRWRLLRDANLLPPPQR
jgi:uncharacterized protein (TIGR02246 family)